MMSSKIKRLVVLFLVLLVSFSLCVQNVYSKQSKRFDLSLSDVLRFKNLEVTSYEFESKEKLKEYKDNVLLKNYTDHPEVFSTAIEYGLALIDLGELDGASKVFEKAEKDFIGNPAPKAYRGWVEAYRGNYNEAKNTLYPIAREARDKALNDPPFTIFFPYHINSVLALAIIKDKLSTKDQEEIAEILEKTEPRFSGYPQLSSIWVIDDLKNGDTEKAEKRIKQILQGRPNDELIQILSGIVKSLQGKDEDALKQFENVEKLNKYSALNHFAKAKSLFKLKNQKEALEEIEKAIALDPDWETAKEERNKLLAKNTAKKWFLNYK